MAGFLRLAQWKLWSKLSRVAGTVSTVTDCVDYEAVWVLTTTSIENHVQDCFDTCIYNKKCRGEVEFLLNAAPVYYM